MVNKIVNTKLLIKTTSQYFLSPEKILSKIKADN